VSNPPDSVAEEDDRPELIVKLQERKERHKQRGRIKRAGVVALGFLIVVAGIVMSGPGVPGPGIATIIVGLALLALEFDWAERWLERAILWADRAAERAGNAPVWQKVLSGVLFVVVIGGFVVAWLLWDIPLLPG
jgi:uncharacterized protein (TIGR02611 family)